MKTAPKSLAALVVALVLALTGCVSPDPESLTPEKREVIELAAKIVEAQGKVRYYKAQTTDFSTNYVDRVEVDLGDGDNFREHSISTENGEVREIIKIGGDATYVKSESGWVILGPPMPPHDLVMAAKQLDGANGLEKVGTEDVEGISTTHYVFKWINFDGGEDDRTEAWIDDQFRVVKLFYPGEQEHRVWDHDIPVTINAPV